MNHAPISVVCLFSMMLLPIHPEGESCSDLGRLLVRNDPLAISVECLFLTTLLLGEARRRWATAGAAAVIVSSGFEGAGEGGGNGGSETDPDSTNDALFNPLGDVTEKRKTAW